MPFSPTFHKLCISPISIRPRVIHSKKENYVWQYSPDSSKSLCEINYIQEGTLKAVLPEGEKTYPPGTVRVLFMDQHFREYCPDPVFHEYLIRFFVYTPYETISAEEVAAWQPEAYYAIVPDCVEDRIACERISGLLKNAYRIYKMDEVSRMLQIHAILNELLAILTEQAVLQARHFLAYGENRRSPATDRACEYIRSHLAEKCSVQKLSKAIGSNYDYLSRVFRRDMNMTVVEYWNRARVHRVEHLIAVEGMSLAQAGVMVGITEPKYISRLFRRYTGITARDFCHFYRGRSDQTPIVE